MGAPNHSINQAGDGLVPRDIPALSEFAAAEFERMASRFSQMVTLEIVIPVASDWPTREELTARNLVEDALMASPLGTCIGAGGGMGQMDLAYRVDDDTRISAARAVIAEAMKIHMPSFHYRIEVR